MNIKVKKDVGRFLGGKSGKVLKNIQGYDGKERLIVEFTPFLNSSGLQCQGFLALVLKEEVDE